MPALTPIRIRGKRTALKAERWHYGKVRETVRDDLAAASSKPTSFSDAKFKPRRRRQCYFPLSKLEQLPTEILQQLFQCSANVNLPCASPYLAAQLKSQHLYHVLTSLILEPVLGCGKKPIPDTQLADAMRLMNSKFFTWTFFQEWLQQEFDKRNLLPAFREVYGEDSWATIPLNQREEWTWYKLQPHPSLLPPKKLLRGQFTTETISFLKFLTSTFRGDTENIGPVYRELAYRGLQQAVEEGVGEALESFWTLGLQPDTELLQKAVIDAGCEREVVRGLVTCVLHLSSTPVEVDFLDPALWSWADQARARGDEKGEWLMKLLRDAAGRKDVEIERAAG